MARAKIDTFTSGRGAIICLAAAIDVLLAHAPHVMVRLSVEEVAMKSGMSKDVFREACFLYMLRGLLAAACENLRGKSFRDEVAELDVTCDLRPGMVPKSRTGSWMRVIPIREHAWPCCAVLLLEAVEGDERPNPPLRTAVEVPPNKILLSAHQLYDAVIHKLSHWSAVTNRLVLLVPLEAADGEYAPAVVRDMELSEDGEGSRMLFDLVIVDDLDELARYFGPPHYGFANI